MRAGAGSFAIAGRGLAIGFCRAGFIGAGPVGIPVADAIEIKGSAVESLGFQGGVGHARDQAPQLHGAEIGVHVLAPGH